MELKMLKSSIVSNNIPNFLIFSVDEPYLAKQYIAQISSTLNKYAKYYDSYKEVIYDIDYNKKDDFVYIILNDLELLNSTLIDALKNYNRTIIAYYSNYTDIKDNLKLFLSDTVKFSSLDKYTILGYLNNLIKKYKISMSQEKLETLIDYCNCNLSLCINELDKIITLEQENSNCLMDYMLCNGFSDYRHFNIYNFINKILNKDKSVYGDRFIVDASCITILTILHNQAKQRFIKTNDMYYAKILKLCSKLDFDIKNGKIDQDTAIDYLLSSIV